MGFSLGKGTYPQEYLPQPGKTCMFENIDFLFPENNIDNNNNISLENQSIPIKESIFNGLYILGSSTNGSFFEKIALKHKGKIVHTFKLGFSDFLSTQQEFKEKVAIECPLLRYENMDVDYYRPKIFLQSENFSDMELDEIQLGDNPFIHIFSITLERGQ